MKSVEEPRIKKCIFNLDGVCSLNGIYNGCNSILFRDCSTYRNFTLKNKKK